jgi:hypothetical protein
MLTNLILYQAHHPVGCDSKNIPAIESSLLEDMAEILANLPTIYFPIQTHISESLKIC